MKKTVAIAILLLVYLVIPYLLAYRVGFNWKESIAVAIISLITSGIGAGMVGWCYNTLFEK